MSVSGVCSAIRFCAPALAVGVGGVDTRESGKRPRDVEGHHGTPRDTQSPTATAIPFNRGDGYPVPLPDTRFLEAPDLHPLASPPPQPPHFAAANAAAQRL